MIDLCEYCNLHGAERDGYCSDSCRRSMELLRAAAALVQAEVRGKTISTLRLSRALRALGYSE